MADTDRDLFVLSYLGALKSVSTRILQPLGRASLTRTAKRLMLVA
jgi:hypothetical protein